MRERWGAASRVASSNDQHGVAITIKSITLADRDAIRFLHRLEPRERGDEDEQAAAREVEVGQQGIQSEKRVPRLEVERRLSPKRRDGPASARGLQRPSGCGANRDDSSSLLSCRVQPDG